MRSFLFSLFLFSILFSSCTEEQEKSLNLRKKSTGAYGEILLVMDTALYQDSLGREIDKCFRQVFPGLPQAEALFKLRIVAPGSFEGLLRNTSNIIVAATFDSKSPSSDLMRTWFSEESIKSVEEGSDEYRFVRKDEFATDQYSVYIFGKDPNDLISKIRKNCGELTEFFNQRERGRITREIYEAKEQKTLSKGMKDNFGYKLRVPFGFEIAKQEKDFLWLSQLGNDLFRNIFIASKPYVSENQFHVDSIVAWRDEIGRNYLFGSGQIDTSSYMTTDQRYLPVVERTVSFNGNYAKELRGLWRLKNFLRGGPFLSFVMTDPKGERLYYIEAFLYAPNKIKRHFMRELEAELYTFKP